MNHYMTKVIAGRFECVDIPDHLRYKEPKVTVSYAGVQPRYLSPPKKVVHQDPMEQQRERAAAQRPPVNPQFAMVESRYRSPPKPPSYRNATKPEEEPIPKNVSVRQTPEYVAHKHSSVSFQHVPSKYYDIYTQQNSSHGVPTPKDLVTEKLKAQHREVSKEGRTFSPVVGKNIPATFGEPKEPPGRKKVQGTSVVMEWIKHGIAIPSSRPEEHSKPRERRMAYQHPFCAPGGAGGGSFGRRNTSPTRPALQTEEKLVQSIKERLQHPPKVTSEIVQRLTQPRLPSPTRTSPTRGVSPPKRNVSPTSATTHTRSQPQTAAHSGSAPRQVANQNPTNRLQSTRAISPKRMLRPATDSSHEASHVTSSTPRRTPISPVRTASPISRANRMDDVEVQVSVLSDLTELGDTPRISVPSYRPVTAFQSPPHLASP